MRDTLSGILSAMPARYAVIIGIALAVTALVLILKFIIDTVSDRSKARKYIEAFNDGYQDGNVLAALRNTLSVFPERHILFIHRVPIERRAIVRAIDYLNASILRDYDTAFLFVERCIPDKRVKSKHQEILGLELAKKNTQLAIAEKSSAPSGSSSDSVPITDDSVSAESPQTVL